MGKQMMEGRGPTITSVGAVTVGQRISLTNMCMLAPSKKVWTYLNLNLNLTLSTTYSWYAVHIIDFWLMKVLCMLKVWTRLTIQIFDILDVWFETLCYVGFMSEIIQSLVK